MSRIFLLVALTSFVASCQSNSNRTDAPSGSAGSSSAGAGAGASTADVPRIAAELVEQHCDAQRKKDVAALERLWADEFTFVNPRGQVLTKAQRLENIRSGSTNFKSLTCTDIVTRSWDKDWAVTTIRATIEGQYSGQEGSGDYRCTFVWAQPRGRWQLMGLQMTRIER